MKKLIYLLVVILLPSIAFSQKSDEKKVKATFYGFVKTDMFWDTRQTVSAREGHFLLFPAPVNEDAVGDDINDKANFNFLSIQSRVGVSVSGPNVLNAKLSGKIEGDFFGQLNTNIGLFRLRHAFVKLNWTKTELLIGQYWNPMFVTDCFPGTVSFNTGSPFQPFARNPQVRLSHIMGIAKVMVVANSQSDYTSRGPNPLDPSKSIASAKFMRNSALPELSAQVQLKPTTNLLFGIGASYKQIVPQIVTPNNYKTTTSVGGYNVIAYLKLVTTKVTFKFEGIYGQNVPDVLMIGGFGVSDSTDKVKGFVEYATINNFSAWTDIQTNGNKIQVGIFAGYSKNLGAQKDIIGPIYGLGTTIESMYRVSPRVTFKYNKLKFAMEGEYTVANYGSSFDSKGIPTNTTAASNFRMLFATYYFF